MREVPALHSTHDGMSTRVTLFLDGDQLYDEWHVLNDIPLVRKPEHDGPVRGWGDKYDGEDCIAYGSPDWDHWHVKVNRQVLGKKAILETNNT